MPIFELQEVIFLGTGAAVPNPPYRNTSSIALKAKNGSFVLLDCGEGTQMQLMQSPKLKLGKLMAICITHLHGDHCFGLFGLLGTLAMLGRSSVLYISGPIGIEKLVRSTLELTGSYLTYEVIFIELSAPIIHSSLNDPAFEGKLGSEAQMEQETLNESLTPLLTHCGLHVRAYPLRHRVPAFGYKLTEEPRTGRLDADKAKELGAVGKQLGQLKQGQDIVVEATGAIVRSADVTGGKRRGISVVLLQDTSDSSHALSDCAHCDILIHEATYDSSLEEKAIERGHSTSAMAGRVAASIQTPLLILTHFSARYLMPKEYYPDDQPSVDIDKAADKKSSELSVDALVEEALAAALKASTNDDSKEEGEENSHHEDTTVTQALKDWSEAFRVIAAMDFMVVARQPKGDTFDVAHVDIIKS